jgi:hypothetical protein
MVIFTYGIAFLKGGALREIWFYRRVGTRRSCSGSPPLRLSEVFRLAQHILPFRPGDPVKHLVHRVLDPGIRAVEFPRCLRGKLAEHVSVPQSLNCIKNTIGAHLAWFSSGVNFGLWSPPSAHWMMVAVASWPDSIWAGLEKEKPGSPK